ncbi:hypothetical protein Osc7112_4696 [Oscillatoria nigro-viridis PCC 7112]|uniref:Glycosyltransferase RgtA/B/C/D-like domain-containing protein n=1 Tax=Phormidium nigroviride PCC 7112 TaxID=179408 RepID=K9VLK8_9CYAN|nr:hypothetical protein [Oscillatoria nigro-viridis]AFZ08983.1 hypothetical protein Osc7112_4696 [Oscillatoria nigro-viridis PCC 7112]
MISYIISFSWGICLLLSLTGWGKALNHILFPKQRVDWGQRAAWGLAFSLIIGGVLNATWNISPTTILIFLGLGLIYCLVDLVNHRQSIATNLSQLFEESRQDKIILSGIAIVSFLILIQYAGWVYTGRLNFANMVYADGFNTSDDYHAYLVFPHKMLQLGSMGLEPFSERRITSLGGQSFLHTFIVSVLSDTNLNIIDPGLALIITLALIIGFFKDNPASTRRVIFTILLVILIPVPKANTTSIMLPVALFLSLFRTLDSKEIDRSSWVSNACIIALISAAICTLKSSLIPASVIVFAVSYLCYFISSNTKLKVVWEFGLATVLVGIFLLPWMISLYQSSGTLLYPLLGKGYHASAYGITFKSGGTLLGTVKTALGAFRGIYVLILILLGCLSLSIRPLKFANLPAESSFSNRQAPLSMTVAALVATVLVGVLTENADPFRYSFSHLFPAIIILIMIAMTDTGGLNKNAIPNFFIVAVFCAGLTLSYRWDLTKNTYSAYVKNIKFGLTSPSLVSAKQKLQYAALQQSIPQGETVLTRLDAPFILDFKRNQLFLADWPGGASLPPGMPAFKGPEALANYLVSKSIRYIAYSSWSLNHPADVDTSGPGLSSWFRLQSQLSHDFRDNVQQLAKTRKKLYEDGEKFVLDLGSQRK